MARVQTIIVGGGIGAGSPFTLNFIPYIASVDPPLLAATDFVSVVPTGVNRGLIVGASDPAAGPERLRVLGGSILRGGAFTGVVIGDGTTSSANNQIMIGDGITQGGQPGVCIGQNAVHGTGGGNAVVIGNGASCLGNTGIVINGTNTASGGANFQITIGGTTTAGSNQNHLNIGATCSASQGVTMLSVGGTCSANNGIGIGGGITIAAVNGIGIGGSVGAGHDNSIVIGQSASTFAAQQCNIGTNVSLNPINTLVIGHGLNVIANPTAVLIRITNSSGNNNTAGALTLQAGLSTGNIVGNGVNLDAGIPGASGVTLQTARTWVSARPTTTAADTGLMVWDVDNATLERVTVGAADSGGAGFKVLRIPN